MAISVAACGSIEVAEGQNGDAGLGPDALVNVRGPAPKDMDAGGGVEPAPEVPSECAPGARACGDGTTPISCDDSGHWQRGEACAHLCLDGACTGDCAPGTNGCSGNILQSCGNDGLLTETVCPFLCRPPGLEGQPAACDGTCVPDDARCDAAGNAETCDRSGHWVVTPCRFLCRAGACAGSCKPGAQQCDGAVPQTCGDDAEWKSGTACPVVCSAGACTDGCTTGTHQCAANVPQTCDASGRWQDGARCPFVCADGVCGGTCLPGANRCSAGDLQTCDTEGAWQTTGRSTRELLVNPAFDLGPTVGWTDSGMIIYKDAPTLDTASETPPYLAWLGGYNKAKDDLSQTVTVPAGAVSLSLSFSYKVITQELSRDAAYDHLYIELRTTSGDVLAVGQLSNVSATAQWTRFSALLPLSLAGQTLELHFRATTDPTFFTSFFVDSVSMEAVACP